MVALPFASVVRGAEVTEFVPSNSLPSPLPIWKFSVDPLTGPVLESTSWALTVAEAPGTSELCEVERLSEMVSDTTVCTEKVQVVIAPA